MIDIKMSNKMGEYWESERGRGREIKKVQARNKRWGEKQGKGLEEETETNKMEEYFKNGEMGMKKRISQKR